MLIADAQVHIWAPDSPERPWLRKPHRAEPFSAEDLLKEMDAAGVSRAVLATPGFDGTRNDLVLAASRAHPDRFCCVGTVDVHDADARAFIVRWRDQPGMKGLRVNCSRELSTAFERGELDWVWAAAEAAGLPVMTLVQHPKLPLLDAIAKRHPRLRLSLVHMGLETDTRDEAAFRHIDRLLDIASNPNVCVNVSALPLYTSDPWPHRALHPYLQRIHEAFGARRMFWGTDLTRLSCSYREAVSMFTSEMPWLAQDDLEWIMGRGLCAWLDW